MQSGLIPVSAGVYIALFIFGILYAVAVYQLQKLSLTEGFTAILVVIGVLVTLLGCYLIEIYAGPLRTWHVLIAFVASGAPMLAGDIFSYFHRRVNGRRLLHDLDNHRHDPS